ncbi:aspartate aminotransferase family protein [Novispirillum sp. DQ9]|uniref:aspartate aminotransferase family protein n=1 Tax=Novispirillum sp. DQ9 TaxID=3398612 RepID=UPI003C7B34DE
MTEHRSHVFHRHTQARYPMAVAGDGIHLIDADGKRYIDASGGAAVSCLGHSDADVRAAITAQVDRLAFAHTGFFTNQPMEDLAATLAARAPGDIDRVYLVSGGSEAVEAALKMARQYFLEIGQPQRARLIARRQSYHGNTLGALATGGNQWRRAQFEPMLIDVTHIDPCYAYRYQAPGESLEDYGLRAADELERALLDVGPETVAAFIAEPVVGATAGAVPAAPGYLKRIREICDKYGVLLILDEVMCGMGRTGTLFACEQDGVAPDMICIAKGLGAGYQPIGATLVSDRIYRAFAEGSGFFQHGHTYMGHATACAAANAVLAKVGSEDMLAEVRRLGGVLRGLLEERFADHPHVGDIRGRGLFLGVELVADRTTKEPFDPARKVHAKVKAEAMAGGLMCYPMGGTIDGVRGDHVLLAPPFICTDTDLHAIVDRLAQAIGAATLRSAP